MPKAQKTPWAGYWEPPPVNQVFVSRADRATSVYDRDVAFRQAQRDALIIAAQEGYQQRGQKRGADFDHDSEAAEFLRTPKARCMPVIAEEDTSMEGSDMVAQDPGDETEHQHANQAPTPRAVPSNGQSLDIQERLAALEGKMQSLDKTTEKHVGDLGYLLPRTTELASVGQAVKKKADVLEKGINTTNDNILGLLGVLKQCSELNRDMISLYGRLVKLTEKTARDLKVTRKALDETRAAQTKDRAAISSLQKELSKMRDEGITKSESTST
ncbi:uncharacterized protein NECHADRAFT_84684 [Fusarium vanettenii 77-13-4]|uniref:Uncharacterized protein n=1 Tax=Fusarium vanettenii (strain ATCC MYA-4622 / CBS 123669 / FGSC 9596 / NRRL 45880 / 77-13-4) TaxID=660122 RepID=C7YTS7_FUSV7|nr:uncharacterized protein NECHADRAFT_84684 [Fusarium vanettenii 77-13-4]EEU44297.1 predicted protein [Fusarium vanettenii 77-13-4]